MVLDNFRVQFIVRLLILFTLLTTLAFLISSSSYHASKALLIVLILLACMEFWHFVRQMNKMMLQFVNDLRLLNFDEKYQGVQRGEGIDELYKEINLFQEQQQKQRIQQEREYRTICAQMELVPTPLVRITHSGLVCLNNRAARSLFTGKTVKYKEDFDKFGESFGSCMRSISAGNQQLVEFHHEEIHSFMSVSCSEIQTSQTHKDKLISLFNIQSELDKNELDSWQNLVSVLTHEIMNSITPVTSLAQSVSLLVVELIEETHNNKTLQNKISEVGEVLNRLTLRSNNLMDFVRRYRRISALPKPEIERVEIESLFEDVLPLISCGWADKGINLKIHIVQNNAFINADRKMIEQVLINLLKNAEEAIASVNEPSIQLEVKLNRTGRVMIQVIDNGLGVKEENIKSIFLPFFTTKSSGSGIGLSLAHKIMMAHGGSIKYKSILKGACFILIF